MKNKQKKKKGPSAEKIAKEMNIGQQKLIDPIELRREVRTYYGVEYALILVGIDMKPESPMGEVNPDQWWDLEFTKKSEKLSKYTQQNFLWADTKIMADKRMQDKYHQCESQAIDMINWLMRDYIWHRIKWLANEVKFFAYVLVATTPQRILYRIKKLTGRQK